MSTSLPKAKSVLTEKAKAAMMVIQKLGECIHLWHQVLHLQLLCRWSSPYLFYQKLLLIINERSIKDGKKITFPFEIIVWV